MSRDIRSVVLAVLLGLAVGVGIGAIVFSSSETTTTTSTSAGSVAVSTNPLTLPSNLAGFSDVLVTFAGKTHTAANVQRQRANQAKVKAATEAAYRQAFAGAATAYRAYSDSALQKLPWVIAVRAPTPGLTIGPVQDPAFLGLATPDRSVMTVGHVSCLIVWLQPTVAGQTPPPSSEHTANCQRSGPGLSVFVGGSGFVGPAGLQSMAGVTNAAWSAVGG
jgi:hypothetical protein